jgi:hypothetical protein
MLRVCVFVSSSEQCYLLTVNTPMFQVNDWRTKVQFQLLQLEFEIQIFKSIFCDKRLVDIKFNFWSELLQIVRYDLEIWVQFVTLRCSLNAEIRESRWLTTPPDCNCLIERIRFLSGLCCVSADLTFLYSDKVHTQITVLTHTLKVCTT